MDTPAEWWQSAVCYQIYPRSFKDTNGDGLGDLDGILEKLDYLNDGSEGSLGIDAIWLNPVYPSPQYDFGYDIMDYQAIDPQYGDLESFDRLLSAAHQRGIRVLMDIVPSVTSHLHPWFIESRSSRTNPKRDWYIWKDSPRPGRAPNNWQAVFGGPAWEWDPKTQQFYYHNSLVEQPDLNWRNPAVERAILSSMEFWFQRGVDGFRIDVLNYTYKDELFRSNPPCLGRRPYEMQQHIYDKDRPEAVAAGQKMRQLTDRYPGRVLVAEIYVDNPLEAARYYGENGDGVHLVFNFAFAAAPFSAPRFRQEVARWEAAVGPRGWPCYFLSNHDLPRHASRFAPGPFTAGRFAANPASSGAVTLARARVAAAMLLTLRGTPFLYMGEELGMLNGQIRRHERLDPVGVRYWPFHPGRDIARTPMQWSSASFAGFSTARPWLPVHPGYLGANAQVQDTDPASLLNWYRRLIWLRKKTPALCLGDYAPIASVPTGVFGYTRTLGQQRVLVALNFTPRRQHVSLPAPQSSVRLLLSWPPSPQDALRLPEIELEPYGVIIAEPTS